jgi:RNA recognition motif-containing protein
MRLSVMEREIEDTPKVFVGNLPYTVRARELGQHFSRCGKIVAVDVRQTGLDPTPIAAGWYG